VTGIGRLQPNAAVRAAAKAASLPGLRPMGEPGLSPEVVDALWVHRPALTLQKSRDEAVAVAGILGGERL
jgi:hypothetical protein